MGTAAAGTRERGRKWWGALDSGRREGGASGAHRAEERKVCARARASALTAPSAAEPRRQWRRDRRRRGHGVPRPPREVLRTGTPLTGTGTNMDDVFSRWQAAAREQAIPPQRAWLPYTRAGGPTLRQAPTLSVPERGGWLAVALRGWAPARGALHQPALRWHSPRSCRTHIEAAAVAGRHPVHPLAPALPLRFRARETAPSGEEGRPRAAPQGGVGGTWPPAPLVCCADPAVAFVVRG